MSEVANCESEVTSSDHIPKKAHQPSSHSPNEHLGNNNEHFVLLGMLNFLGYTTRKNKIIIYCFHCPDRHHYPKDDAFIKSGFQRKLIIPLLNEFIGW